MAIRRIAAFTLNRLPALRAARAYGWNQRYPNEDAIEAAGALLLAGGIVAIKALGGFHLACDATNAAAVARLRQAKHRDAKPFALMARDIALIQRYARVAEADAAALSSPVAPIVLLQGAGDTAPPRLEEAELFTPALVIPHDPSSKASPRA